MTRPADDKIQVTVFGPGFGECILIHIGDCGWIIIDSCLNDDREPAGLSYLRSINVDPATDVRLIVATHWHDDHIKGLFQTLEACKSSDFAMSAAMSCREFLAFLIAHDQQPEMSVGRGGTEIIKCLKLLRARDKQFKPVTQDRLIKSWDEGALSHGKRVELLALSPSDAQLTDALAGIASFNKLVAEKVGSSAVSKKRIASENKNDLSIAALLIVGDFGVLFGADVEERNRDHYGWRNIVNNRAGRAPAPIIFKVAHHGSEGAHLDDLWNRVLHKEPIAVVTPWKLGGGSLPKEEDLARLRAMSSASYITSSELISLKKRYDRGVLKDIERSGVNLTSVQYKCGSVNFTIDARTGNIENTVLTNSAQRV